MKKYKLVVSVLLILSLIVLPGCTGGEKDISQGEGEFDNSPVSATLVHGNPSGVWFMLSTGISESLSRTYEGSVLQTTPGHNFANLLRMEEYTAEFGITHSYIAYEGVNGFGQFEEKLENVGGIAVFYPSIVQFAIKKDYGITTFDEFIEQKVPINFAIGKPGANSQIILQAVLGEYGLTYDDIIEWGCKLHEKSSRDTAELFTDGVCDGIWIAASAPSPVIMEMATNDELVMLSISGEIIAKMVEEHGFNALEVPAGSYDFLNGDVPSFTTYTMLGASLQTSEVTAYKLTRAINENLDYISTIHASLEGLTSEKLIQNMGMPLHPGAEKYYREIGLID